MIRNLRTLGDDEKRLMLLKESLQLAIKNDEAVSAARAGFQQGKPLESSVEDTKTLAERIADSDKQMADARSNLMQLFKPPEVFAIMSVLSKDQIIGLNTLWSGMKKELEKVNTKLMTPQDFVTFLNKYTESAVSLQGALNVGINSTDELKQIIPDAATVSKLKSFLQTRPKTDYLIQQLDVLDPILPSATDYDYLDLQSALTKQVFIDAMSVMYPNKILLERALDEGNVSKIEKLLQVITPIRVNELTQISDKLASLQPKPKAAPATPAKVKAAPATPAPSRIPLARTTKGSLSTIGLSDADAQIIRDFEAEVSLENTKFLDSLNPADKAAVIKHKNTGSALTPRQQSLWISFLGNNEQVVNDISRLSPDRDLIRGVLKSSGFFNPPIGQTARLIGQGLKLGRGRPSLGKTRQKMKVGEGIKHEKLPTNVEFGKYAINTRQLKNQILSLKGKSGGALSWFQATPISDAFTEMLQEMITGKGLNKHILKTLDKDEQNLFYEVADRAELLHQLQLKKPKNTQEEDIKKRFDILLGEYKAGNNNPSLIAELRKHIIYFTTKGKIPKSKSLAMLLELS
jgi:hypothetical protein